MHTHLAHLLLPMALWLRASPDGDPVVILPRPDFLESLLVLLLPPDCLVGEGVSRGELMVVFDLLLTPCDTVSSGSASTVTLIFQGLRGLGPLTGDAL